MNQIPNSNDEITLAQAKQIIMSMGTTQSILMLASPGVGKSAIVEQIADALGYECRSLLGTQIAPEDISGIPRIEGTGKDQRSVFYPPKILLPADKKPFVLFLDELPICNQEVQKAMYSLLFDRKIGDRRLPAGTIVVAAGNNIEDNAMVRAMSTALVNRVIIRHIKVSVEEWLLWGSQVDKNTKKPRIREDIRTFIAANSFCLQYKDPKTGSKVPDGANEPFSTPRSWAAFSEALDRLEAFRKNPAGCLQNLYGKKVKVPAKAANEDGLTEDDYRILARGCLTKRDADLFCDYKKYNFKAIQSAEYYIANPDRLPTVSGNDDEPNTNMFERAIILQRIKLAFSDKDCPSYAAIKELGGQKIDNFFTKLPKECVAIMTDTFIPVLQSFGAKKTVEMIRLSL